MKHNERAWVAPQDSAFTYSFRAQKKTHNAQTTRILPGSVFGSRLLAVVGFFWARSLRSS